MEEDIEQIKRTFSKKLQRLMLEKNKKQSDLSRELNIPDSTISDWCLGKVYPRPEKIMLLAKYFNIEYENLTIYKQLEEENKELKSLLKSRLGNVTYKGYRILRLREEEIKDLLGG